MDPVWSQLIAPSDPMLALHQKLDNDAPPAVEETHILIADPSVGKPFDVGTTLICPAYCPGITEKGSDVVVPGSRVTNLVLPVALLPPEPKLRLPLVVPEDEVLPVEVVLPEEEVLAVEDVLAVEEVLAVA